MPHPSPHSKIQVLITNNTALSSYVLAYVLALNTNNKILIDLRTLVSYLINKHQNFIP
jgi:hypothetical protein